MPSKPARSSAPRRSPKTNVGSPKAPMPIRTVGIIGLGLMGQGIATCLLAHGFEVIGLDTDKAKFRATQLHVARELKELNKQLGLAPKILATWKQRLHRAEGYADLASCELVLECVREDLALKRSIFAELEQAVPQTTIIASNTSSLPITLLQQGRLAPGRYLGMHWGEPAQIMRYLEIIPGKQTKAAIVTAAKRFGIACGKEPAVLKQDIRGFLSNRLMYAMMREAFHLVESGIADIETVDQSFRNDIGWWALLAGPFRWMDLTGIPAYAAVMEGLLPELSTGTEVPKLMKRVVRSKALGVANAKGFYPYTPASAKRWEQDWVQFTYEVRKLAERYTPTA
ncbi:3-hydroxyacyl-CoA dehydrogenase family protein [Bryocella elongata]|nr:3-hydroxyacyl-CoA dehydrogenase family protein [Bryocella elongata]